MGKIKGRNTNHARPEALVCLRRNAMGAPIAGRSLVSVSSKRKLPVFGSNALKLRYVLSRFLLLLNDINVIFRDMCHIAIGY
jgi:hypothetical protein